MKKIYSLFILGLLLIGMSSNAIAQTTIMSEDFADATTGNSTSSSGSATAWTGNANFPTVAAAYQAGGAVKLGTSSKIGSATSIPLDLSVNNGEFKVKIKVKGWTAVEGKIKITPTGLEPQTLTYTATMANDFEEIEAIFTGGTAAMQIKIETTAKRAFIDDVVVYYGGTQSNDATLSSITVDGVALATFDPATVSYFVTLNNTTVPVLVPTLNDPNATLVINNATSIPGQSEIIVTAENGTTERTYAFNWSYQPAEGEKGSKTNPYTISEAVANQLPTGTTTKYWVKGFIVGTIDGGTVQTSAFSIPSNIALAETADADISVMTNVFPIELPTGSITRTNLNLVDKPSLYKAEILVYGTLENYFTIAGLKQSSDFEIKNTVSINNNEVDGINVYAKDGNIVVTSKEDVTINIYSATGKLVATKALVNGEVTIPASQGTYIVKVGNKIAKVVL